MNYAKRIVLPAPMFRCFGGWVLDTQFVTNMGTPYLLAHGLGKPVADAWTEFAVSEDGKYWMYVYTFNWVAPWKPEYARGVYEVHVDGCKTGPVFGCKAAAWGWETGDAVSLTKGNHRLQIHDLTGFEGRIGMVVLSREPEPELPASPEAVRQFLFDSVCCPEEALSEVFDLVVCGGGMAGTCAALSAARNGLKTVLIQDRPMVGGNNSSEVRVWLGGETHFDPFPGIGNIINEMEQKKVGHHGSENAGENYEDGKKMALLINQENLTVYTEHIVTDVQMEATCIRSVTAWDYRGGKRLRIKGKLFSDCTGDAALGHMAGADYEVTTNGHMGASNLWYVEKCEETDVFPACPWAMDLKNVDFPGKKGVDIYGLQGEFALGAWFWESGHEHDPIEKAEYIRDTSFRAMYGAWDVLKNHEDGYENYRLGFSAFLAGKRESRRLLGDVVLTKMDVQKGRYSEDGCVPSTWSFDVHYPDKRFYPAFREGDAFIACAYYERFNKPYFIPYRAMYSRNIGNMFMAGRNVSVSHDALGTVRVMRTGGMMGEVVGYAAKLCCKYDILPREVYQDHLEEFMAELKAIPERKNINLVANV